MLFEIRHVTKYSYSEPVFLEPHTLRFCPRSDGQQRLKRFKLAVNPKPSTTSQCLDHEGNIVTESWFREATPEFEIVADFAAETLRADPFDYLTTSDAENLPIQYSSKILPQVTPYLERTGTDDSVAKFARLVTAEAKGATLPFLFQLAQQIHATCRDVSREEGDPLSPAETLANGEGSCRDLTVLFMEACRIQGIASRFVSGYQVSVSGVGDDLHAWAEVYV